MQENSWQRNSSKSPSDPSYSLEADSLSSPVALPSNPAFVRGLEGRRRKSAVLLAVVWSSTIILNLLPIGEWLVLGLTALMGIHLMRLLLARSSPGPNLIHTSAPQSYPYVSLLVAAKNEEAVIASLVEELCDLDYPKHRYELWVIDDCSTDQTPIVLDKLSQEYEHLHVLHRAADAGGGKSGALNDVWPLTKGDILAVFDADAQVPENLLLQVIPLFDQENVGAVQVRKSIVNACQNIWTHNQSIEMILDSYLQQQRIAVGGIGELRGNGQFVRRTALAQCDGWNEQTITDDLDLTLRLHLKHWDIHFLMHPSVGEEGVSHASALWHQRNRWAEGGYQRYLDYWRLLVSNTLGIRKTADLLTFCFMQYIIPTAAIPDLLMAIVRNRLPLLSPLTGMTVIFSFISMILGMRRIHSHRLTSTPLHASARQGSHRESALAGFRTIGLHVLNALQGTVYMLHWLPVISSTTLRVSIRPKRLKWVKTIHRGSSEATVSESL